MQKVGVTYCNCSLTVTESDIVFFVCFQVRLMSFPPAIEGPTDRSQWTLRSVIIETAVFPRERGVVGKAKRATPSVVSLFLHALFAPSHADCPFFLHCGILM